MGLNLHVDHQLASKHTTILNKWYVLVECAGAACTYDSAAVTA